MRYMLIQEYYNSEMNFPIVMIKKLNAVEEVPLKQYSDMKGEIELSKALRELERYGVAQIA
ncbi:hypothetical protein [Clostridium gasigenes]|nr:hypothetical protein [Clostridium gasigenes]